MEERIDKICDAQLEATYRYVFQRKLFRICIEIEKNLLQCLIQLLEYILKKDVFLLRYQKKCRNTVYVLIELSQLCQESQEISPREFILKTLSYFYQKEQESYCQSKNIYNNVQLWKQFLHSFPQTPAIEKIIENIINLLKQLSDSKSSKRQEIKKLEDYFKEFLKELISIKRTQPNQPPCQQCNAEPKAQKLLVIIESNTASNQRRQIKSIKRTNQLSLRPNGDILIGRMFQDQTNTASNQRRQSSSISPGPSRIVQSKSKTVQVLCRIKSIKSTNQLSLRPNGDILIGRMFSDQKILLSKGKLILNSREQKKWLPDFINLLGFSISNINCIYYEGGFDKYGQTFNGMGKLLGSQDLSEIRTEGEFQHSLPKKQFSGGCYHQQSEIPALQFKLDLDTHQFGKYKIKKTKNNFPSSRSDDLKNQLLAQLSGQNIEIRLKEVIEEESGKFAYRKKHCLEQKTKEFVYVVKQEIKQKFSYGTLYTNNGQVHNIEPSYIDVEFQSYGHGNTFELLTSSSYLGMLPGGWLSQKTVDFQLEVLFKHHLHLRSLNDDNLRIIILNTCLVQDILSSELNEECCLNESVIRKHFKENGLSNEEFCKGNFRIIFVYNVNRSHFVTVAYEKKALYLLNSLNDGRDQQILTNFERMIQSQFGSDKFEKIVVKCSQQKNSYDCGIYSLIYAQMLIFQNKTPISEIKFFKVHRQGDADRFRCYLRDLCFNNVCLPIFP